ncbi:MAG: sigma 54-interacting transcriptional regulator [Bacteroidetes bacterium]|nr:sigma 54-interacting transcriptional regulator [Bacteroidota bacterium]
MFTNDLLTLTTVGDLRAAGYPTQSVKDELRNNLLRKLKNREPLFPGIYGYEKTVIPEIENAVLSKHNIILLGLRGQAKTRLARLLVNLLDEYVPVLQDSEVNDHPFHPISLAGKELIATLGDKAPIQWIHRSDRYGEKLATPDVTVADLIGDLDPIKAAAHRLSYSDERILHYGIIPRTNRGIFVINELPDLQPRIQVSLFNILQEADIQIRGFKTRIPMDIMLIFTANPEDYTNRGSIITPLKDRIDSQIITHYPKTIEVARKITEQESFSTAQREVTVHIPDLIRDLVEQLSFEARESEFVDHKSGVSARLAISAFETLISQAERRAVMHGETETTVRIMDLYRLTPSITGKIELVYEGEQEGMAKVATALIQKAIRSAFKTWFPDPSRIKSGEAGNPYKPILEWFSQKKTVDLLFDDSQADYEARLRSVTGLAELAGSRKKVLADVPESLRMEFILEGLSLFSVIGKDVLGEQASYKDIMGSVMKGIQFDQPSGE